MGASPLACLLFCLFPGPWGTQTQEKGLHGCDCSQSFGEVACQPGILCGQWLLSR